MRRRRPARTRSGRALRPGRAPGRPARPGTRGPSASGTSTSPGPPDAPVAEVGAQQPDRLGAKLSHLACSTTASSTSSRSSVRPTSWDARLERLLVTRAALSRSSSSLRSSASAARSASTTVARRSASAERQPAQRAGVRVRRARGRRPCAPGRESSDDERYQSQIRCAPVGSRVSKSRWRSVAAWPVLDPLDPDRLAALDRRLGDARAVRVVRAVEHAAEAHVADVRGGEPRGGGEMCARRSQSTTRNDTPVTSSSARTCQTISSSVRRTTPPTPGMDDAALLLQHGEEACHLGGRGSFAPGPRPVEGGP